MDLLALADFNLVARHGGFGKAARAANRPKATLSRRVSELEAALGLRLFERGNRDLKLTEEGRALHLRTGQLLSELQESATAIASGGDKPRGRLRISAPLLFSQTAMGKIAAGFALEYPEIRLEVTTDDRSVDMIEEGYDLVIRVNPRPDESLVGRVFLRDRLIIVASPGLSRPSPDSRVLHPRVPAVIRGSADPTASWKMTTPVTFTPATPGETTILEIEPILSLASMTMVRDAVLAGVGAGRLPLSLTNRDLQAGRLVLWGDAEGPETALWGLYPSRRLLSARVSAFLAYLTRLFPTGRAEELSAFLD